MVENDLAEIKLLVGAYYDIQQERIEEGNRVADLVRRKVIAEERAKFLHEHVDEKLKDIESDLEKQIKAWIVATDIWKYWLGGVCGIGEILAAGLFVGIQDIKRFDNVGRLYTYCGQATVCSECKKPLNSMSFNKETNQYARNEDRICKCTTPIDQRQFTAAKHVKGQKGNWSPFMKTLCWKTGESFVKSGKFYREIYDKARAYYDNKYPAVPKVDESGKVVTKPVKDWDTGGIKQEPVLASGKSKGHRHAMAKRRAVKLFLSHLWLKWRVMEGLPVRDPYPIEHLGHTTIIHPPEWEKVKKVRKPRGKKKELEA